MGEAILELKEGMQRPGGEEVRKWVEDDVGRFFEAPVYFWGLGDERGGRRNGRRR